MPALSPWELSKAEAQKKVHEHNATICQLLQDLAEARRLATEYRNAYGKHFYDGYSGTLSLPWETPLFSKLNAIGEARAESAAPPHDQTL